MRKELTGLIFLFFFILSSISLFSYHNADPCVGNGFFTIPPNIHNTFGLVGAHIAGLLIFLFGTGAFLLPVILTVTGICIFMGRSLKTIISVISGGLLLMLTTGGLLSFFTPEIKVFGCSIISSGIINKSTVSFLSAYTNKAGCAIILIFLTLFAINLTTGTSFIGMLLFFIRKAGTILIEIKEGLQELIAMISEKYKNREKQEKEPELLRRQVFSEPVPHKEEEQENYENHYENEDYDYENEENKRRLNISDKAKSGKAKPNKSKAGKTGSAGTAKDLEPDNDEIFNSQLPDQSYIQPDIQADMQPDRQPDVQPHTKDDNYTNAGKNKKPDIKIVELPEPEEFIPEPDTEVFPEENNKEKSAFKVPPISFLDEKKKVRKNIDTEQLKEKARILENKLGDFNISGEVAEILPGPVITTFEYRPAPGIKISRIAGLANDLALALSALSIRIVAPIPGRDVVGIEIPNDEREIVHLRDLIASAEFAESSSFMTLCLGKDILGRSVVTKMDSMPHLLIAGATGTGKSVGLNSMIISLLYKSTPDDVKIIMIDPKRIELSVYQDIPHLISPVVTDMKKATNALLWAVKEMERRYELLEQTGCRNIIQYNAKFANLPSDTDNNDDYDAASFSDLENVHTKLPYIVVIVDELADLMMVASKDVEFALTRLAQMARAAGIHLIVATQRPSVDVLTGNIKANFPTRISFQVSSRVDARIIFDGGGSETLLGNGDMLFCPPGAGKLTRIQGAYISEQEIARITHFLKAQREPDYQEDITLGGGEDGNGNELDKADYDDKYDEAVALVTQTRQASISFVQRRMRIGYNRAARLIEIMEKEGIVGPQIGSKPREILVRGYDDV